LPWLARCCNTSGLRSVSGSICCLIWQGRPSYYRKSGRIAPCPSPAHLIYSCARRFCESPPGTRASWAPCNRSRTYRKFGWKTPSLHERLFLFLNITLQHFKRGSTNTRGKVAESKSEKFGRDFRVVSRWEATSQKCSDCGLKWGLHRSVYSFNTRLLLWY